MMVVDVLITSPHMDIQREQRLPFPGNVLVKEGDTVQPDDVVAEAAIPGSILNIDIARALGVDSFDVSQYLTRDLNEELQAGDVIAQREGRVTRLVRAPVNGRLVACHAGKVSISTEQIVIQKIAGMIGEVAEIIPELGAVMRVRGSLLQGVWGNGKAGAGILRTAVSPFDFDQNLAVIETLEQGQVFAAGSGFNENCLDLLVEKAVSGLILGSLEAGLIRTVQALPIPVVVLQGFGDRPADAKRFGLLALHEGEMVSVNGCEQDLFEGRRPEVIIPNAEGNPLKNPGYRSRIAIGQRVQIQAGVRYGHTGKVIDLTEKPMRFESGLVLPSAIVELTSGDPVAVPSQNLIILS